MWVRLPLAALLTSFGVSGDKSLYTGITWNLRKRLLEHKGKLPVVLKYWESFEDRSQAARREKEIKGWGRVKKLKLIESLRRVKRDGV